ncbi:MAG: hypothetical protein AAF501_20225, partial [Pseudomonadota bacterium]
GFAALSATIPPIRAVSRSGFENARTPVALRRISPAPANEAGGVREGARAHVGQAGGNPGSVAPALP